MATRSKSSRTPKRAPKRPKTNPTASLAVVELERWDALLARAQREAIQAAPRHVPLLGDGQDAAIQAYDTIRYVRQAIGRALGAQQAAGGAS
jgi:hypothetical protein